MLCEAAYEKSSKRHLPQGRCRTRANWHVALGAWRLALALFDVGTAQRATALVLGARTWCSRYSTLEPPSVCPPWRLQYLFHSRLHVTSRDSNVSTNRSIKAAGENKLDKLFQLVNGTVSPRRKSQLARTFDGRTAVVVNDVTPDRGSGRLHVGYTARNTGVILGVGVSRGRRNFRNELPRTLTIVITAKRRHRDKGSATRRNKIALTVSVAPYG